MKKLCAIILAGLVSNAAAVTVTNLAATSVTTTSGTMRATFTGITSATGTLYYGTVDYTTNVASWAYTNAYGAITNGVASTNLTGLSASHKYYYTWRASQGGTDIWASASTNFWTKPIAPTSTPAVVTISVQTDTNADLKSPTNFFGANVDLLVAAGVLTNEALWQASSAAVMQVVTDFPAVSNAATSGSNLAYQVSTGAVMLIDAEYTDTVARAAMVDSTATAAWWKASADGVTATAGVAAAEARLDVVETGKVDYVNATYTAAVWKAGMAWSWGNHADAGYATGTPLYVESDPVWAAVSNLYLTTNEAASTYATGTPVYAESDPVWASEKSGYATGTPVYAESDPVWASEKSGYATGTPVYAESDPVWSGVSGTVVYTNDAIYLAVLTNATEVVLTNSWGWEKDGDHQIRILVDTNTPLESVLTAHTGNTNNPHAVTSIQIGALPMAGGSMTGVLFYGTNRLYLGSDTNAPWIRGLGTTNIMFGAGTNTATFGAPW